MSVATFAESFGSFNYSHERGVEDVTECWNGLVEDMGLEATILAVRDWVKRSEGWTVEDLRFINELADQDVFNC